MGKTVAGSNDKVDKTELRRLGESVLKSKAYVLDRPMLNLEHGGQYGLYPVVGRIVDDKAYEEWINNTPYISQNLIAVLISYPKGFDLLDGSDVYIKTLKSLIELHSKSIEGLNQTIELEHEETPVGGSGAKQHTVTNSTFSETTPTHTYEEKLGMPITAFHSMWIEMLIMDPVLKKPKISTLDSYSSEGFKIYTPDFYTMTVLYFEPDPTARYVNKAWLVHNMMPKSSGEIEGKKDIESGGEKLELSIEYTGIPVVGDGVKELAMKILTSMNSTKIDPNMLPLAVNMSDNINEAKDTELRDDADEYKAPVGVSKANYIYNTDAGDVPDSQSRKEGTMLDEKVDAEDKNDSGDYVGNDEELTN